MAVIKDFSSSLVANLFAKAGASKIPPVSRWAETVGNLAEQASDKGFRSLPIPGEPCQLHSLPVVSLLMGLYRKTKKGGVVKFWSGAPE